jgi:hypothetical protein
MNYLYEAAKENFTMSVMDKGWKLYYKKALSEERLVQEHASFTVAVRDGEEYRVGIDCDFFAMSECDCGSGSYCAHMAAAFFHLYALQGGRPELFLKEFVQNEMVKPVKPTTTSPRHKRELSSSSPTPKSIKEQQEKERRAETARIKLEETSTTVLWHTYFRQMFESYKSRLSEDFNGFFPKLLQESEQGSVSWPKPLADLFKVQMLLDYAGRIEDIYHAASPSFYSYYYMNRIQEASEDIRERMIAIVSKTDRQAIRSMYEERLEETAKRLHDYLCLNKQTAMGWIFLYRYMWWNMLNLPALRNKEALRLQRSLKKPDITQEQLDYTRFGIIHMHFIEGREEEALVVFANEIADKEPAHLSTYLQYYLQTKQWDKLLRWMKWMIPYLKNGESDFLDYYFDYYWAGYAKGSGNLEHAMDAMRQLLPYTYERYSDRLMKIGDYRNWVDLQLSMNMDPDELEASELRKVGSSQMSLLLPLYHQSIERNIEQKNRESYRTAAQYLGKLRDCYYKIKSPQLWNAYLAHIKEKYSRLRALQEELKKGKLIS